MYFSTVSHFYPTIFVGNFYSVVLISEIWFNWKSHCPSVCTRLERIPILHSPHTKLISDRGTGISFHRQNNSKGLPEKLVNTVSILFQSTQKTVHNSYSISTYKASMKVKLLWKNHTIVNRKCAGKWQLLAVFFLCEKCAIRFCWKENPISRLKFLMYVATHVDEWQGELQSLYKNNII